MWDDDDEYFPLDGSPKIESPVHHAIAVVLGIALVLVAVFW